MMRRLIFPCTPFTRQLKYTMEHDAGEVIDAFCVNQDYLEFNEFEGVPVYPFEKLNDIYDEGSFEVIIASGYKGMNELRMRVFKECDERGYRIGSFIHPGCLMQASKIGRGNIISDGSRVFPFSEIGDGNIILNSLISHEAKIGNFNFVSSSIVGGISQIDDNCFLGINSAVGDNVHVGSYSVIGGGVFLANDVGEQTLVSPATPRIVKSRAEIMGKLFK